MSTNGFDAREIGPADYEPVAERIVGFRAWSIDTASTAPLLGPNFTGGRRVSGRGLLRSIYQTDFRWGPGKNISECGRKTQPYAHSQPVDDCMCGFWAYTNGSSHYVTVAGPAAFGMIEGWGHIVIGPYGFRAQYARIVALCFPTNVPDDFYDEADDGDLMIYPVSPIRAIQHQIWRMTQQLAARFTPIPAAGGDPARQETVPVPEELGDAVRSTYSRAAWFTTASEMLKAHPPTDLRPLLPKEPDSED